MRNFFHNFPLLKQGMLNQWIGLMDTPMFDGENQPDSGEDFPNQPICISIRWSYPIATHYLGFALLGPKKLNRYSLYPVVVDVPLKKRPS
jgi:hypothetical protein